MAPTTLLNSRELVVRALGPNQAKPSLVPVNGALDSMEPRPRVGLTEAWTLEIGDLVKGGPWETRPRAPFALNSSCDVRPGVQGGTFRARQGRLDYSLEGKQTRALETQLITVLCFPQVWRARDVLRTETKEYDRPKPNAKK